MTTKPEPGQLTRRYFYTDPLAAAWMAKHFGIKMEIIKPGYDNQPFEKFPLWLDRPDWGDVVKLSHWAVFYIHPDSLHLLEPQAGDVCQTLSCGSADSLQTFMVGDASSVFEQSCDLESAREQFEDGMDPMVRYEFRIIQRDGKPFFWPEVEP